MTDPRILVVGLDGATWDLVGPWAEAGHLPTIAALMKRGIHGPLESVFPPVTAPAWTSFYTGSNPGKHGVFDFYAHDPAAYRQFPVDSTRNPLPTLFDLLTRRDVPLIALNPPLTYPVRPVTGLIQCGLPFGRDASRACFPGDLLDRICEKAPAYVYNDPDFFLATRYKDDYLAASAPAHVRSRFEALHAGLDLLPEWRFTFFQVQATDVIAHFLWRHGDVSHPQHDPSVSQEVKDGILNCYRAVDEGLDRLLQRTGDELGVVIMSDHGHGALVGHMEPNVWLAREGFLHFKQDALTRAKKRAYDAGLTPARAFGLLRRSGAAGAAEKSAFRRMQRARQLAGKAFLSFEDVDWQRTEAYSTGPTGQVYVNLKGREPQGSVEPGAQYERVVSQLAERLAALRHPETGEPLVEEVRRKDEVYSGPYTQAAADVLFKLAGMRYAPFPHWQFMYNRILNKPYNDHSGQHRMEGIFVAAGGPFCGQQRSVSPRLIDVTPTLLYALGLPVPTFMDGRVLGEVLDPQLLEARPVEYEEWEGEAFAQAGYSGEEAAEVTRRLENLGYI
jgi:predicted AlkP superfamily phosphohydrolase/phosphomutase